MFRGYHTLNLVLLLSAVAVIVHAKEQTSAPVFASEVGQSEPVQRLQTLLESLEDDTSSMMRSSFDVLFPFDSPAKNALIATFYISSLPNIVLAFIPSQINPSTMNIMTAFAAGGLLSDVFVHLIPATFMGGEEQRGVTFVLKEDRRNVLLGLSIFLGFAFFYMTEKLSRTFGGDDSEVGHGHSHSHADPVAHESGSSGTSTSLLSADSSGLRSRSSQKGGESESLIEVQPSPSTPGSGPSLLSAYLNLLGDFMHNITDGLVIAASFYSSPLIGATSTLACLCHEFPHEIADFSILVRSGFTKRQAMGSQFLTAIGAFVGTFLGIAIQQAASNSTSPQSSDLDLSAIVSGTASGILGTSVEPAELVIPAIAGGFIYIATVAVVPVLLQENRGFGQAMKEFLAMGFGVACMVLVAWNE